MIINILAQDAKVTLKSCKIDLIDLFSQAGHTVVSDDNVTHNTFDSIVAQNQVNCELYKFKTAAATKFIISDFTYLNLLDKAYASEALENLSLNNLNTKEVFSIDDIINFADTNVILKPRVGMNSKSTYSFIYKVMSKDELLQEVSGSDINFGIERCIIQEAVTNDKPIIWIGGYVNPQGEIHIDGILDQKFSINDKFFEDELRYPDRYNIQIQEVPLIEATEFHNEAIRQIKVVLQYFRTKSTPFCIQCIVDDDNQVQILDFNFGFGKGYGLRIREKTPQYIIDRIKYTYGGADSIPPNNTYMMNFIASTPNGTTDAIKNYIDNCAITMVLGLGQPDKDYTFEQADSPIYVYHPYESRYVFLGSSKEEVLSEIEKFKTFLSTLT